MGKGKRFEKILLLAIKIAVGSAAAIYLAEKLHLEFASSAGTIALLTLMTTKWEAIKLSGFRLITFFLTAIAAFGVFSCLNSVWIGYGLVVFFVVLISELFGWRAAVSVNAVIATHFMSKQEFGRLFVLNELMLVLIGIAIALVLNLFHLNNSHKKNIIAAMRYTEEKLQSVLRRISGYLSDGNLQTDVWEDICVLEKELQEFLREAYEYQDNTFHSHPAYYINYFRMRYDQCQMLTSLHAEMKRARSMPQEAGVVSEFICFVADHVTEKNVPDAQMENLHRLLKDMEREELPKTKEELAGRALLFHILMDMEEFLKYKLHFIENLTERQRKEYWE